MLSVAVPPPLGSRAGWLWSRLLLDPDYLARIGPDQRLRFFALSRPISTSLRIASERLGKSGSRRRQLSTFFTHAVGTTMFSRWISSSN